MEWIWFVLIGFVAGWLAAKITNRGGIGLIGYLIVGVIGAVLGGFLMRLMGFQAVTLLGNLISATIGSVVLVVLLRFVRVGGKRPG